MTLRYRYKRDADDLLIGYTPGEEWDVTEPRGRFLSLSTGFRDTEGREIFEGDVLETADGIRMEVRFGVYPYTNGSAYGLGFFVAFHSDSERYLRNDFLFWKDRSRVIGNVFEEPELMK